MTRYPIPTLSMRSALVWQVRTVMMRSVVTALCEELVRVKDSLDLSVRSDRSKISELEGLMAPLKQIGDTLAVLGFGQPRKVIVDQIDSPWLSDGPA